MKSAQQGGLAVCRLHFFISSGRTCDPPSSLMIGTVVAFTFICQQLPGFTPCPTPRERKDSTLETSRE